MNEIFISRKDKDYVLTRIDDIFKKYNMIFSANNSQRRAILKNCCHDIDLFIDECFEPSLLGVEKYKQRIKRCSCVDDPMLVDASLNIIGRILSELQALTYNALPLKDYPSCRNMVGLTSEDIASKAKDLVKNDVVKASVCFILLGLKIGDAVKISDIKGIYQRLLDELLKEIEERNNVITPIEQELMEWFNAEIGYCELAMLKAGMSIGENVSELIRIAKKNIDKYEKHSINGDRNSQLGYN